MPALLTLKYRRWENFLLHLETLQPGATLEMNMIPITLHCQSSQHVENYFIVNISTKKIYKYVIWKQCFYGNIVFT